MKSFEAQSRKCVKGNCKQESRCVQRVISRGNKTKTEYIVTTGHSQIFRQKDLQPYFKEPNYKRVTRPFTWCAVVESSCGPSVLIVSGFLRALLASLYQGDVTHEVRSGKKQGTESKVLQRNLLIFDNLVTCRQI